MFFFLVQIEKQLSWGKLQGPPRRQAIILILGLTFQVTNKITSSGDKPSPHQILSNPFMRSSYAMLGAISSGLSVFCQSISCRASQTTLWVFFIDHQMELKTMSFVCFRIIQLNRLRRKNQILWKFPRE